MVQSAGDRRAPFFCPKRTLVPLFATIRGTTCVVGAVMADATRACPRLSADFKRPSDAQALDPVACPSNPAADGFRYCLADPGGAIAGSSDGRSSRSTGKGSQHAAAAGLP